MHIVYCVKCNKQKYAHGKFRSGFRFSRGWFSQVLDFLWVGVVRFLDFPGVCLDSFFDFPGVGLDRFLDFPGVGLHRFFDFPGLVYTDFSVSPFKQNDYILFFITI